MTMILDGTNGEVFPTWTTATRPASPVTSQTGWNTTIGSLENYNGTAWAAVGGGGAGAWQTVQSAGFTAVSGNAYACNTTSAAFTVTLPASPAAGNYVQLVDYAGTWSTNKVTVNPNGLKINASTSSVVLGISRQAVAIVYIDATQGWICYSQGSSVGSYTAQFLVVAGGGGGGSQHSGGGGAGGFRTSAGSSGGGGSPESALTLVPGTTYTAAVGAGGVGGVTSASSGAVGTNSSISTITSVGGGGGASWTFDATSGGSGGGDGGPNASSAAAGTANQGYAGGVLTSTGGHGGGGGGGAGAVGGNGTGTTSTDSTGGAGGVGVASTITGSSVFFGGGGGGGCYSNATLASGGNGGGGNGGTNGVGGGTNATAGTVNTGGGGGGAQSASFVGAAGGSGVVILSVPTSNYSGITTGSPTITTSGANTIIKFNSSGTYTA